jgi:hypothetical protein
MLVLTPQEQAAISGSKVVAAALLEMDLAVPLYMNSSTWTLNSDGKEYIASMGIGEVEGIQNTAGEYTGLRFRLSGVPPAYVALADSVDTAGKGMRIKFALFDPETYQIISARVRFEGRLQPMVITDAPEAGLIEVNAESLAYSLMRPVTSLFSDAEQQRLYPGDLFFQFASEQADMRIVWPAASWGRQ